MKEKVLEKIKETKDGITVKTIASDLNISEKEVNIYIDRLMSYKDKDGKKTIKTPTPLADKIKTMDSRKDKYIVYYYDFTGEKKENNDNGEYKTLLRELYDIMSNLMTPIEEKMSEFLEKMPIVEKIKEMIN